MITEIYATLQMSIGFLMLFGVSELLYKYLKPKAEFTRKIVHVGGGLLCLQIPILFKNSTSILFLVLVFGGFLWASTRFGFLPSVNNIQRSSKGSVLFPFAIGIAYCGYYLSGQLSFFYIPLLILTFCDPFAYFIGKTIPVLPYSVFENKKTFSGSLAFIILAFFITWAVFSYFKINLDSIKTISFVTALTTGVVEAVSNEGFDNVFIPFSALVVLFIFS